MERNPAVQAAEEAVAWAKRPSMVSDITGRRPEARSWRHAKGAVAR